MTARTADRAETKTLPNLARHFYALKDAMRLEMIALLARRGECTVNDMAAALNKSQPLVSWHLRRLSAAGVVKMRRSGREVHCSLDRASIARYQKEFLKLIQPQSPTSNHQSPISNL
jgi:DNA-binding transcriptional ArsR family regulator